MKRYIKAAVVDSNNADMDARYATRSDVLSELAKSPNKWTRMRVAKNPNTPADILYVLADDEDEWVRREVVLNPNADLETLRKLTDDSASYVIHALLINDRLPWSERAPLLQKGYRYYLMLNVYFVNDVYVSTDAIKTELNAAGYGCTTCYMDSDAEWNDGDMFVRAYCEKIFSTNDARKALDIIRSAITEAGGSVTNDEYVIDG